MKLKGAIKNIFMTEEILEIVDNDNRVIGTAGRSEIHKKHFKHRSVHVFLFNSAGDLFLQKRVHIKDEFPGYYDSSAAGHVNPGESYHEAAARELKEELGIEAQLEKVAELPASQETGWEFVSFYSVVSDDAVMLNHDEIEEGRFYSLREIREFFISSGDKFTPSFKTLFEIYQKSSDA
jgi:isopentenyl-diphosphate delta-isomerase type 1